MNATNDAVTRWSPRQQRYTVLDVLNHLARDTFRAVVGGSYYPERIRERVSITEQRLRMAIEFSQSSGTCRNRAYKSASSHCLSSKEFDTVYLIFLLYPHNKPVK